MGSINGYSMPYHAAVAYLVAHGGYGPDPSGCRLQLAKALRTIKSDKGLVRALDERRHLLFISGHFPDNPAR